MERFRNVLGKSRGLSDVVVRLLRHDPKEQNYRFFWLKRVEAVDLDLHCQPCLLGPKSMKVRTRMFWQADRPFRIVNQPLEKSSTGIYYMCGVTIPHVWKRNFHLAFRRAPGHVLRKKWFGVAVEIENAVELYIDEVFIEKEHPRYREISYRTCRNAQFAWGFKKGLYLPGGAGLIIPEEKVNYGEGLSR